MTIRRITWLWVWLLAGALAQAGLLEFSYYGETVRDYNSSGLGLISAPAGPGDPVLSNPALLATKSSLWYQVSGRISWRQEKRTREVFDSYSNSVGLNTDLLHSQFLYQPHSLSAGYSFRTAGGLRFGAGLGLAREYSFDYSYRREIRDAFYYLTEIRDSTGLGQIIRSTLILSGQPLARLSLGLGISRLQGHQELRQSNTSYDPATPSTSSSYTRRFSGSRFDIGLWALPFNRLSLSLTVRTPAELSGKAWGRTGQAYFDTNSSLTYPASYTFGLCYYPANDIPASVSFEYSYTPWQRLKDNLNPEHRLQPVNAFGLAVEHRFAFGLPVRFGLSYANSYLSRGLGLARAGLGTQVSTGPASVSLAANIGRRSYNLGQALGSDNATTVTESMAELLLTVSPR